MYPLYVSRRVRDARVSTWPMRSPAAKHEGLFGKDFPQGQSAEKQSAGWTHVYNYFTRCISAILGKNVPKLHTAVVLEPFRGQDSMSIATGRRLELSQTV